MEQTVKKSRQELRSEETKRCIREAAGRLFAERGFNAVTMREIAKAAGCSHTTIYLYYKDKETLLEQLALPPLTELEQSMKTAMVKAQSSPEHALYDISGQFIRFCLSYKSMVPVLLGTKAVRVDEKSPTNELNSVRLRLFGCITETLDRMIQSPTEEERIQSARIYFFMLQGLVATYMENEEPLEELLQRILPMMEEAANIVLLGMKEQRRLAE